MWLCKRYTGFSLSRDLARKHDEMVMWPYGWDVIKASYHSAQFSHSGGGVIMILVRHVISQHHVIKGSYDFVSGHHSW